MSAIDAYDRAFDGLVWVPGRTYTMGSSVIADSGFKVSPAKILGDIRNYNQRAVKVDPPTGRLALPCGTIALITTTFRPGSDDD